jgi:hypothetical protein
MEDKYYIPSIEEFYVGFEYEGLVDYNVNDTTWVSKTCNNFMWHSNELWKLLMKNINSFRVKYLDREDIESLGWIFLEDRGMSEYNGNVFIKNDIIFQQANYELRYWYNVRRLKIERINGIIFDGIIKNKSELKVLLKQLDIHE